MFVLCLPEILLALLTLIVSFLLAERAGVHFYFCLPDIVNIMCKPMLLYCIPLVTLYELTSRCARRYLAKRERDVGIVIREELVGMYRGADMARAFYAFVLLLIMFGLFYTGISNLKPLVPLYNPRVWDAELLRADALLLAGNDWSAWLSRFHRPVLDELMNLFYLSLFPMFGVTITFLLYARDVVSMRRLILSMMGITLIGNLWHFLMPSLGDVYVHGTRYRDISTVYVRIIQNFLYYKQMEIVTSPASFTTAPFIGLAAIPSLHVAQFLVYVLVIRKRSAILFGGYMLLFAGLFFSTLYFGWHYIIDSIAGGAIAVVVYLAVSRRLTEARSACRAGAPDARVGADVAVSAGDWAV